ncbi:hypothetical protein ESA94_18710 [Lacibacter luteus]|uniref:Uncharacterized protein n=1 Tax=Lacibacter luteus TaxID=2508719 RepID=A0A4Q1CE98_9BACT|nr:hypothetical protein [Lacibacter luteus]RXK58046.1 hypothetical protein ESA94_18710 [Lacibacter luteus]
MANANQKSELDKYRDIVIAGLDYTDMLMRKTPIQKHDGEIVNFGEELGSYFSDLKNHALTLHKKNKLSTLKRWFKDISEMSVATGNLDYQFYIETTTGHKVDLFGKLFEKIDKLIKVGQIKTDTQYRTISTMIDFLESYNPPDIERIKALDALQFAYSDQKKIRTNRKNNASIGWSLSANRNGKIKGGW